MVALFNLIPKFDKLYSAQWVHTSPLGSDHGYLRMKYDYFSVYCFVNSY